MGSCLAGGASGGVGSRMVEAVAVLKGVRGGLARVLRSSVGYSAVGWRRGAVMAG